MNLICYHGSRVQFLDELDSFETRERLHIEFQIQIEASEEEWVNPNGI